MKLLAVLAIAAAAAITTSAQSQTATGAADNLGKALPPDVLAAIQKATEVRKLFPVNSGEKFSGQILKADEIVFAPGATLTLTALDAPYIAIIAKRWKFADATVLTKLIATGSPAPSGADGGAGADTPAAQGETGRRGHDGAGGGAGLLGADGQRRTLPHIYLIAGDFSTPKGEPLPGFLRMSLIAVGIDGGSGGKGGKGGKGGAGASGKVGATSAVDCKEGPGPGGNGGTAGQGGQGGRGGDGSDGADITMIGTKAVNEIFSYVRIFNDAGYGGREGRAGSPGQGGARGSGAGRNGWCGPSDPGNVGVDPVPIDLGTRGPGKDGAKGDTTLITVKDLSPIF